jgi:hypothetical protein
MEAVLSIEVTVTFHRTTRSHIPKDNRPIPSFPDLNYIRKYIIDDSILWNLQIQKSAKLSGFALHSVPFFRSFFYNFSIFIFLFFLILLWFLSIVELVPACSAAGQWCDRSRHAPPGPEQCNVQLRVTSPRQQDKSEQNHENANARIVGQGQARRRKYKRLKLDGYQAYGRSND